tara:strand:+ start:3550 stop:4290 length:741 start_codon:yes stop_codon:yes gene_type:complete
MSNFFTKLNGESNSVADKVLGPKYDYAKNIKPPNELGMSSRGSIPQAGRNVRGLIDYTEVLVTGSGRASRTGGALGSRFFLETGAKCKDIKSKQVKTRSIYISNKPTGAIPFITSGTGSNFKDFKGLIPGAIETMGQLNPVKLFQSFMIGGTPNCQAITMETIDGNNNKRSETKYVANSDIRHINACVFPNRRNPVTGKRCKEFFTTIDNSSTKINIPDDPIVKLYYTSLGLLGLYILYKLTEKQK